MTITAHTKPTTSRTPGELPFMEIYRRPEAAFIKAGIIAWNKGPEERTSLCLFATFLRDTTGKSGITVDRLLDVLSLLDLMDEIRTGDYFFDTHPQDPERAIEEGDARDNLDDQINALIGAMA